MPYTSEHYHFQPRIPHPDKLQINHMDRIKTIADVHNFNIFTSSESSLRELLIHCSIRMKECIKKEEDVGPWKAGIPQKRHKRGFKAKKVTAALQSDGSHLGSCGINFATYV